MRFSGENSHDKCSREGSVRSLAKRDPGLLVGFEDRAWNPAMRSLRITFVSVLLPVVIQSCDGTDFPQKQEDCDWLFVDLALDIRPDNKAVLYLHAESEGQRLGVYEIDRF
jgi:hypothetical protein